MTPGIALVRWQSTKAKWRYGGNGETEATIKYSTPNLPIIEKKIYKGVKNVRFSENLASFVFLLPPFRDSPFWHNIDQ